MTNERYYDSRCGHVVALLFSPDLGHERPEMRRICLPARAENELISRP